MYCTIAAHKPELLSLLFLLFIIVLLLFFILILLRHCPTWLLDHSASKRTAGPSPAPAPGCATAPSIQRGANSHLNTTHVLCKSMHDNDKSRKSP